MDKTIITQNPWTRTERADHLLQMSPITEGQGSCPKVTRNKSGTLQEQPWKIPLLDSESGYRQCRSAVIFRLKWRKMTTVEKPYVPCVVPRRIGVLHSSLPTIPIQSVPLLLYNILIAAWCRSHTNSRILMDIQRSTDSPSYSNPEGWTQHQFKLMHRFVGCFAPDLVLGRIERCRRVTVRC